MGFLDRFKKSKEKEVGKRRIAGKILAKEKKEIAKASKKEETGALGKKAETGLAYRYLIKPMISEKASVLASHSKYVFVVHPKANKIEVAKAVEKVFNVEVRRVNIIKMRSKAVRFGRLRGKTKGWKKAIVTLAPGQKIEIYEGV
jgi:large subunit ribosomal protein L23